MADDAKTNDAEAAAAAQPSKAGKLVKVRVLTDTGDHKCGNVVEIDRATLESNPNDFDPNPAAVAYALGVISKAKDRARILAEAQAE
ncbi:MAG: hypothetical protein ING73_14495 [Rhodocyclaceae bacterium]|nr:hypothetical protein [Rhodocyclaceae bacterium]